MNPSLASRAKRFAARRGQTFTEVIEQAVADLLERAEQPAGPIELPTRGDPGKRMSVEEYEKLLARIAEEDMEPYVRMLDADPRR